MTKQPEPEFYFDKEGKLWFAHECKGHEGSFLREYTLPRSIYEVIEHEPATVA